MNASNQVDIPDFMETLDAHWPQDAVSQPFLSDAETSDVLVSIDRQTIAKLEAQNALLAGSLRLARLESEKLARGLKAIHGACTEYSVTRCETDAERIARSHKLGAAMAKAHFALIEAGVV